MLRSYFQLTKFGIVCFVLFTGTAAYFLSMQPLQSIDSQHFLLFLTSLYLVSSSSFALNQFQESHIDAKMERTQNRPLPSGAWSKRTALLLITIKFVVGFIMAYLVNEGYLLFLLSTVLLYNGLYTLYWKKHWAFGAVPGAIPGAMPIVLGFSANHQQYSLSCLYLFVLMFLWQMPHFWALALRYQKDYAAANIPVLPVVLGSERALYHVGMYVFAYGAWAVFAPWFISVWIGYLAVILPFVVKVVLEFMSYQRAPTEKSWLSFFLWTTFSVLVFVIIPVFDKWGELLFNSL